MLPRHTIERVHSLVPTGLPADRRFVIAIAGPPAAGKSTLAAALVESFDGAAGLLEMDGFHFDNAVLDTRGHRPRKGAPHTFDAFGYATTLRALRASVGVEMSVPVFDRALGLSRNCASMVRADHQILVTEGNYLLLDSSPWDELLPLFDLTVWLDVPLSTIERRIHERWREAGHPAEEIVRRAEENDLPNARHVQSGSVAADLVLREERVAG